MARPRLFIGYGHGDRRLAGQFAKGLPPAHEDACDVFRNPRSSELPGASWCQAALQALKRAGNLQDDAEGELPKARQPDELIAAPRKSHMQRRSNVRLLSATASVGMATLILVYGLLNPFVRAPGLNQLTDPPGPVLDTDSAVFMPSPTGMVAPTPPPTLTPVPVLPAVGPTSTLPRVLGPDDCTDKPQPTAVPTRAPRLRVPDNDIVNIALIGTDADVEPTDPSFRTDTLLIVSINRTTGTVAILSIARDLYVCIPKLGMNRINVAFQWGEAVGWTPGGGFGLLQETILYNLGIPIHFYASVSFSGFKSIIDTLQGIDVAVDCPMVNELRFQGQYNALQTPQYTPFTLPIGYYHMDGSLALWYARVRHTTSDFDRNRRQQQILRAIWRRARDQGLIQKAPELWSQAQRIIKTDLQLGDILGLVPLALSLQPEDITSYTMVKGLETEHWTTPAGEDVQIPDPARFFHTIRAFYAPHTPNHLAREVGTLEVVNGTANENWDKVAADTLGWRGFNATAAGQGAPTARSVLYDYTGSASPAVMAALLQALNMKPAQVISQPDPNRAVDFRVILGADYNSCSAPGFGK